MSDSAMTPPHAPPFGKFEPALLGPEFPAELRTVSGLWFRCGYGPGIAAYLNFFLLRDFIVLHDRAKAARFLTWQAMAKSFYETDLFIRAVTDSGREATGGISSPRVQQQLQQIMRRHAVLAIPPWMMTYFGWSLFEAVEAQCAPLDDEQRRLHLAYMSKAWRLMGISFANDRAAMAAFARDVERRHAALAPQTLAHARSILRIGELIGVSSRPQRVLLCFLQRRASSSRRTRRLCGRACCAAGRAGCWAACSCRAPSAGPRTAVPFASAAAAAKP
jgi:hypothetical protein